MSIGNAINKCNHNHNHNHKDKAEEMNVCKILKVNKGEGSNNGNGKDNNSNGNNDSVNNLLINKQQSIAKINNQNIQNKNPLTFQGIQPNNTTEN